MSPIKEVGIEASTMLENEYSLGEYNANKETETTFNNLRKFRIMIIFTYKIMYICVPHMCMIYTRVFLICNIVIYS